jgi:hypothetical protein
MRRKQRDPRESSATPEPRAQAAGGGELQRFLARARGSDAGFWRGSLTSARRPAPEQGRRRAAFKTGRRPVPRFPDGPSRPVGDRSPVFRNGPSRPVGDRSPNHAGRPPVGAEVPGGRPSGGRAQAWPRPARCRYATAPRPTRRCPAAGATVRRHGRPVPCPPCDTSPRRARSTPPSGPGRPARGDAGKQSLSKEPNQRVEEHNQTAVEEPNQAAVEKSQPARCGAGVPPVKTRAERRCRRLFNGAAGFSTACKSCAVCLQTRRFAQKGVWRTSARCGLPARRDSIRAVRSGAQRCS